MYDHRTHWFFVVVSNFQFLFTESWTPWFTDISVNLQVKAVSPYLISCKLQPIFEKRKGTSALENPASFGCHMQCRHAITLLEGLLRVKTLVLQEDLLFVMKDLESRRENDCFRSLDDTNRISAHETCCVFSYSLQLLYIYNNHIHRRRYIIYLYVCYAFIMIHTICTLGEIVGKINSSKAMKPRERDPETKPTQHLQII